MTALGKETEEKIEDIIVDLSINAGENNNENGKNLFKAIKTGIPTHERLVEEALEKIKEALPSDEMWMKIEIFKILTEHYKVENYTSCLNIVDDVYAHMAGKS